MMRRDKTKTKSEAVCYPVNTGYEIASEICQLIEVVVVYELGATTVHVGQLNGERVQIIRCSLSGDSIIFTKDLNVVSAIISKIESSSASPNLSIVN